jgi:hypothetical protein
MVAMDVVLANPRGFCAGVDPEHPELCGRCVSNVAGSGEDRRWF